MSIRGKRAHQGGLWICHPWPDTRDGAGRGDCASQALCFLASRVLFVTSQAARLSSRMHPCARPSETEAGVGSADLSSKVPFSPGILRAAPELLGSSRDMALSQGTNLYKRKEYIHPCVRRDNSSGDPAGSHGVVWTTVWGPRHLRCQRSLHVASRFIITALSFPFLCPSPGAYLAQGAVRSMQYTRQVLGAVPLAGAQDQPYSGA